MCKKPEELKKIGLEVAATATGLLAETVSATTGLLSDAGFGLIRFYAFLRRQEEKLEKAASHVQTD